jgi:hypothetical protein
MTGRDFEHGEEVPLSYWKNVQTFSMGLFALIPGFFALWFAGALFADRNSRDLHWALMVLFSLLFSCGGLGFLGMAAFLARKAVWQVWRRDRLFLGENELLCVAQDGRVLTRIPYDNIEEITLMVEEGAFQGPPVYKVGVNLLDPGRKDTVLLAESPLAPHGEEKVDALIGDFYRIPPKKLYKKLLRKWEKHR